VVQAQEVLEQKITTQEQHSYEAAKEEEEKQLTPEEKTTQYRDM
jgi:hypothetical protein